MPRLAVQVLQASASRLFAASVTSRWIESEGAWHLLTAPLAEEVEGVGMKEVALGVLAFGVQLAQALTVTVAMVDIKLRPSAPKVEWAEWRLVVAVEEAVVAGEVGGEEEGRPACLIMEGAAANFKEVLPKAQGSDHTSTATAD